MARVQWLPALVFLGTAIAFVSPAIVAGETIGGSDLTLTSAPYSEALPTAPVPENRLQSDQAAQLPILLETWSDMRSGQLNWWNPDVGAGVPQLSASYTRALTPWYAVMLLVGGAAGLILATALAFLMVQWGTYGLARRLGLGVGPATLAGVAYAFSGPTTALLMRAHEVFIFPWVLFALHGAIVSGVKGENHARYLCLLWVSLTALLLAGFPAAALFVLYAATAWVAYLVHALRRGAFGATERWSGVARALWPVAAVGLAAVATAAPLLISTYRFLAVTGRLDRSYGIDHAAGLNRLATTVSGKFFGAFQDGTWWWPERGYSNPVEASMTMGVVALILIVLLTIRPVVRNPSLHPITRFFVPVGLVVLVGTFLGGAVLGVMHQLPFMDSNSFGRSRFILALAVALLAGLGAQSLVDGRTGEREVDSWLRYGCWALLVPVGIGLYDAVTVAEVENQLRTVARAMVVPALMGAVAALAILRPGLFRKRIMLVMILALAVELQWGAWEFTPSTPSESIALESPALDAVRPEVSPGGQYRLLGRGASVLRLNAASILDVRDVRVDLPAVESYREMLLAMHPEVFSGPILQTRFLPEFDPTDSILLDRLSARFFIEPLRAPLLEVREVASGDVPPAMLPTTIELDSPSGPVRGVSIGLETPGDCTEGWVEVRNTEAGSRRLLRDLEGERLLFPMPDVERLSGIWEVSASPCEVRLTASEIVYHIVDGDARLDLISTDGWSVYERASAMPRAALATEVVHEDSADEVLMRMQGSSDAVFLQGDGADEDLGGGRVQIARDGPNDVHLEVASEGEGLLVLRDVHAPGWVAYVDGERQPVLRADHTFRAVRVPSGVSNVVFSYEPIVRSYWWVTLLFGLSVLVVVSFLARYARR